MNPEKKISDEKPYRSVFGNLKNPGNSSSNPYPALLSHLTFLNQNLKDFNLKMAGESDYRIEAENNMMMIWQIIEKINEAIVITNLEGKIINVNPAYCQITGYSKNEIIGKNPKIMKSGIHDKVFYKKLWEHIVNNGSWQGEIHDKKKDGSIYIKWLKIDTIYNDQGTPIFYVGIFTDISWIREIENELNMLAFFDPLTGLPNRKLLKERLAMELVQHSRYGQKTGVIFIDLNRFKFINDSLGHSFGDKVLQEVARRLKNSLGKNDTAARFGEDEFIIIIRNVKDKNFLNDVAEDICHLLKAPVKIDGKDLHIEASMGISIYPDDGMDAETIVKNSETAMYRAKADGHRAYYYYTHDMKDHGNLRLEMENLICSAIEKKDFLVFYQPLIDIKSGKIISLEALIRWNHKQKGFIPPDTFIPIAEECGFITSIEEIVIEKVCQQISFWKQSGFNTVPVAINLSPVQFKSRHIITTIEKYVKKFSLSPEDIEFELTERVLMDESGTSFDVFDYLRKEGYRFSLDDFGTGFSSLSYLTKYDVYKIKIDRSFTHLLAEDDKNTALTRSILLMAKNLGILTVAEGVESESQLDFYMKENCDVVQGFIFSKPLPGGDIIEYLKRNAE